MKDKSQITSCCLMCYQDLDGSPLNAPHLEKFSAHSKLFFTNQSNLLPSLTITKIRMEARKFFWAGDLQGYEVRLVGPKWGSESSLPREGCYFAYSCSFCWSHRIGIEQIHFIFKGSKCCWALVASVQALVKIPQHDLTESFQRDSQYVTHFLTVQGKSPVSNLQKYCTITAATKVYGEQNINTI